MDAIKDALKAGVQVVTAPQLFPTPVALAERMAGLASINPGDDVLEPSAGTGRLLDACFMLNSAGFTGRPLAGRTVVVEVNFHLAGALRERYPQTDTRCADFLSLTAEHLGQFDAILMNPPFENGQDIQHIRHAITLLKPGGRLVAICADGPRQRDKLRPFVTTFEPLPAGTFKESGTSVNTVLLTVTKGCA